MKKTKMTIATIALVLMLAFSTILVALQTVKALDLPTYAFLTATPNPIGVGQTAYISWWLTPQPLLDPNTMWVIPFEGITVTITKPDGTNQIMGPYKSDPVGGNWFSYVPDTVGTYKLQAHFPGQNMTGIVLFGLSGSHYYKPCTSSTLELTVQQEPIKAMPEIPLPDDYWERPIYGENREWSTIGGNWLMPKYDKDAVAFEYSGNWNPYTTAPKTAHIVWTEELAFGGIAGGESGVGIGYYTGLQYEPKFTPPIIMNGIIYYNTADPPKYGFKAVDLRTGETLWYQNSTHQLSFGQIYDYESPNQHGCISYLWSIEGNVWHMFDAFTGNYILSINNVPSGFVMIGTSTRIPVAWYMTMGPSGEVLVHSLNPENHWLCMWNSSKAIPPPGKSGSDAWLWRPDNYRGQTLNGTKGIQWNVTIPNTVPAGSSFQWYWNDILISQAIVRTPDQAWPTLVHAAFNAKTGEQLWTQNRTDMGSMGFPGYITPNEGVYALFVRERKQWVAWDVTTGSELWRTDPIEDDWGFYEYTAGFAYGKFYSGGYSGRLGVYDATTGELLWDYYVGDAGFDTPYGSWPIYGAMVIADGKIIVGTNEHSPSMPIWRGEKLHVIDAETGLGVWNISGIYASGRNGLAAIADGYLVTANGYDNRIYCFGKGKTATTVTASSKVIAKGDTVLIEGTVTDQSPGDTCLGIPAAGTPAIADEYMTEWMEYLYMQQPCPMNLNGVPVKLEAFSEDGSYIELGTVTSNAYGDFVYEWTPPDEKLYTIMATFDGSDSYWRSYDATYLSVGPAVAPSGPIEPEPSAPLITTEVAIIVAVVIIAVVGIVAYWMLRKRK